MTIAIHVMGFLSVFAFVLGAAWSMTAVREQVPGIDSGSRNALTESPVGGLIRLVAKMNRGDGLAAVRSRIEQRLLRAGRPGGEIRGEEYLAAAELAGMAALALVFLTVYLLGADLAIALAAGIVAGLVGGWMVVAYLNNMVTERRLRLSRRFPYFLDLAVMAMEAGSSFMEAVQIYVRDNPGGDAVAEELRILAGEVSMGKTMQEALENLSHRVTAEEVQHMVKALIQGQQMGTPLGEIIRDQASAMRFKRSQLAERASEELKVKITGPVTLMMVSILLVILGPAFVTISNSGVF